MSNDEKGYTETDEKVLAMNYAMTALIKLLSEQGHIEISDYVHELTGAIGALNRVGEVGAEGFLESYRQHLCQTFGIATPRVD
jgi:hypothetical protein